MLHSESLLRHLCVNIPSTKLGSLQLWHSGPLSQMLDEAAGSDPSYSFPTGESRAGQQQDTVSTPSAFFLQLPEPDINGQLGYPLPLLWALPWPLLLLQPHRCLHAGRPSLKVNNQMAPSPQPSRPHPSLLLGEAHSEVHENP